ncbi:NADPH-dependent F420 reductase [Labedella endophytica]|uniref:Diguanylate cyclase n=1 Tax=Labedella endophytica TaxID=1523160 RepID=A0A3S0XDF2_9MICO|nr:NAD(P)-binding domain-containing protein [Labedella endophytica]RUR03323.1 diguanylate cyclase [Labedella endophytica]
MTSFSIIGTGNMARAIAGVVSAGGADVQVLAHGDLAAVAPIDGVRIEAHGTALSGDIVVLAVPYGAIDDIVATYGGQLAGKTVVDITNPVDFATFDSLAVPAGSSAAAEIATKLPASSILKAFNTNFAATLATKSVDSLTTTVLVAGDDADAKTALVAAVEAGGVRAIDAGSLKRAIELEAVGFLQLTLAAGEKTSWTSGFALAR